VAVAAYRISWTYRQFERSRGSEGLLRILAVLDQIFEEIASNESPAQQTVNSRLDLLLKLTPHSEEGFLASQAISFNSLIHAAQQRMHDKVSLPAGGVNAVFCYTTAWTHFVGGELFNCLTPGNADPAFVERFNDKVLRDPRVILAIELLRKDISKMSGSFRDFSRTIYAMRDQAISDSNNFLETMVKKGDS
jgi:hypothetical protein